MAQYASTHRIALAVDGGGTKTELVLVDEQGETLAQARTGSTSPKAVTPEQARENMRAGAQHIAEQGFDLDRIEVAVYGLGGLDLPEERPFFERMLQDAGLPTEPERAHLTNDGLLPLYAAGETAGSVIIAGTGSIAFNVDGIGSVRRVGGWGYGMSDLGSGNWVGTAALRWALLACDHAVEPDGLLDELLGFLGLNAPSDLLHWAAQEHDGSTLARLARPTMESAAASAARIRERAAEHLAELYRGLVAERPEAREQPVVLAGGLFNCTPFAEAVESRVPHARVLNAPPVQGAVNLARRLLTDDCTPPEEYPPRLAD